MSFVENFFEHSLEFMCIAGADGFFKRVNPAFCQAVGYNEQELTSTPFREFFLPEDRPTVDEQAGRALQGATIMDFELRFVTKGGAVRWLSWRANSINGSLYVTARDISRFKDVETKFQETFENTGVGIAHARLDGTITLANRELCEMLGYSRSELVGINYYNLFGPGDTPTPSSEREDLLSGRIHKLARERHILRKDGASVWNLITVTIVRDDQGTPQYSIIAHKDITRRRTIEESFRALVEVIPQMVWTATPNGDFDFYNQRWYDFTGYSPKTCGAQDWQRAIHPQDLDRSVTAWRKAVAKGESYETEYRIRDARSGAYRWQLARALPLHDKNGSIVRWFGTYTDIDDQKRTQAQLIQSLGELKRSSEERAQLMAKERAATEASRLKSEFLATMTHEIRTPLNGVIAMAGLMLETALTDSQKEYADAIAQSADSLLAIVNDILDLSKIEAGKLDLETVDFDLRKLATSAVLAMDAAAAAKNLPVRLEGAPEEHLLLRGDPSRLRQIFFNLLHNAVKFTERGHIVFRYRSSPLPSGRVSVRFEVEDTGIGIETDAIDRIWADFEQAESSTTRRYGGTGLGLAICRRLVQKMGGTLGVRSTPGQGSVFWLELPFELGRPARIPQRSVGSELRAPLRRLRILVAEDHAINQKVIRRVLESQGHHVDVVADGREALIAVNRAPYDLIILDCHMPQMDGFAAAREIRASIDARIKSIPIIALTADVRRGTREKCLDSGMSHFCSKPIDSSELDSVIRAAMAGPIDMTAIARLRAINNPGQADLAKELIEDFLNQVPKDVESIKQAVFHAHPERLAAEAHKLKSVSATLGASRLSAACLRLEELGHEGATRQAASCLGELADAAEAAQRALWELLMDSKAS